MSNAAQRLSTVYNQLNAVQGECDRLREQLATSEATAKRSIEHKYLTNELVPVELLRATEAKLAATEAKLAATEAKLAATEAENVSLRSHLEAERGKDVRHTANQDENNSTKKSSSGMITPANHAAAWDSTSSQKKAKNQKK